MRQKRLGPLVVFLIPKRDIWASQERGAAPFEPNLSVTRPHEEVIFNFPLA